MSVCVFLCVSLCLSVCAFLCVSLGAVDANNHRNKEEILNRRERDSIENTIKAIYCKIAKIKINNIKLK